MTELLTQLGIDWKLLLAQAVNFGIVAGVLAWFVFRPLLRLMEQRRTKIEEGVRMREQAEEELKRSHEARKAELQEARQEAERILEEAKGIAGRREQEILEEARQEAERMIASAKEVIDQEREASIAKAKEEVVALAIGAAEKAIARSVTEQDEERLRKEVTEMLQRNHAQ